MWEWVWASAGFAFGSLALYFNAMYLSSEVASVRDKLFNEALQAALTVDSPVTPSQLMDLLRQKFGFLEPVVSLPFLARFNRTATEEQCGPFRVQRLSHSW